MPIEAFFLGALFIATMSFTPGPANLSLLSVGASLGLSRAMPYVLGIWAGGLFVIISGALGLGALFLAWPDLFLAMKLFGFAYICWLAWKLARAGFGASAYTRPPSFWAGFALHPVNPKAYVQNMMVFSAFIVPGYSYEVQATLLVLASLVAMVVATVLWGLGGDAIRRFVSDLRAMRFIAVGAAVLMVVSVAAAFLF